jgi:hypothetical protein
LKTHPISGNQRCEASVKSVVYWRRKCFFSAESDKTLLAAGVSECQAGIIFNFKLQWESFS